MSMEIQFGPLWGDAISETVVDKIILWPDNLNHEPALVQGTATAASRRLARLLFPESPTVEKPVGEPRFTTDPSNPRVVHLHPIKDTRLYQARQFSGDTTNGLPRNDREPDPSPEHLEAWK